MTKLEQLSELLVSEISQFEKTVARLERIQKQQIGIDSSNLESALQQQHEKMEKALAHHRQEMKSLGYKLQQAKAYPVWIICVFIVSVVLNVVLFIFI